MEIGLDDWAFRTAYFRLALVPSLDLAILTRLCSQISLISHTPVGLALLLRIFPSYYRARALVLQMVAIDPYLPLRQGYDVLGLGREI